MVKLLKDFIKEEDGLGTVEIVVIIAVLVGVALIFRKAIFSFVTGAIDKIFDTGSDAVDSKDAKNYAVPTIKP